MPGYVDMMEKIKEKFPLTEPQIIGEQNHKNFVSQFRAIFRMHISLPHMMNTRTRIDYRIGLVGLSWLISEFA